VGVFSRAAEETIFLIVVGNPTGTGIVSSMDTREWTRRRVTGRWEGWNAGRNDNGEHEGDLSQESPPNGWGDIRLSGNVGENG